MDWFILESNHMRLDFFLMKSGSCLLLNRNWNSWSASKLAVLGLFIYAYRCIGTDNATLSSLKQGVAAAHWSHKEACSQEVHVAEISHRISTLMQIRAVAVRQKKKPLKILNRTELITQQSMVSLTRWQHCYVSKQHTVCIIHNKASAWEAACR